jgi:site-specific DNA recombinase
MKQDMNKIKYFLYARKSSESEDRQVASIESQINELKKIAEQEGLEIVEIFQESQSAKAPGRPVFNSMIERIYKNEAQGILCWKLDRLARNPIDGGQISWLLQQGVIKHIQTYGRSYYPTDNVLMMSVEFGMANQFVRDLSTGVKRGLKTKVEKGWYPVHAPVGYLNNRLKLKGEKDIIKDPDRFSLVRKMFDLMLTGNYTPPKILEIATKEWGFRMPNGKPIARSTLYRIFTDSFYYGMFEYPKKSGNWYKGAHEPMITEEEFDRIQVLLGRKGKPRPKNHMFAFTGMIRCGECGALITAEEKIKHQRNGNIRRYIYYHCTKRKNPNCSQKGIKVEDLEAQIIKVLDSLEIPTEFHDWALKWLRMENEKEANDRNTILASQQNAYDACVKKIDTLIDMRAAGEITEAEFSEKKAALTKEKIRLQELLTDTDNRVDKWLNKAEQVFAFARDAHKKFETGGLETKKAILSALGSNLILKDKILSIDVENSLIPIIKSAKEVKAIHKRLESQKTSINKRTLEEMYSQSPTLLRW